MIIEHDSRNSLYRFPFGAVPCLSTVVLRLFVKINDIPRRISLVYSFKNKESSRIVMYYVNSIAGGSLYEAKLTVPENPGLVWYYFIVETNADTLYYGNNDEKLGGLGKVYHSIPPSFQITVYKREFKTPDWFKKAIIYQIFPDRFSKGGIDSFETGRSDIIPRKWDEHPFYKKEQFGGEFKSNDFFGGNLTGIKEKLPYLHDLGITAIYLNPIFKAYSNHKYDVGDYEVVDPMFGSNEMFQDLCSNALKYGIRIILDGVFSHTGSDSRYFNKNGSYPSIGAYQSKDSPYYNWYSFIDFPDDYECWWGFKTLPQTKETESSFMYYILTSPNSIVKKWLALGASGWRLDVADELPFEFIKTMRREVKAFKPDSVIIGEVWEDASNKISYGQQREFVLGEELDSVTNYPLRNAIIDFACGNIDAYNFGMRIMSLYENYPKEVFYSLMNFLSSHDVERIITIIGDAPPQHLLSPEERAEFLLNEFELRLAKRRLKNAVLLQMTLPGVPCIYYGDEAGMQGYGDPFNRKPYPWSKEDKEVFFIYKKMIALRKNNPLFINGNFEIIYMYQSCFAFTRYNNEKMIVVSVNMNKEQETFTRLDLARFDPVSSYDMETKTDIPITDGIIIFTLPPLSFRIIEVKIKRLQ